MSLVADARAALASMITAESEFAVAVVIRGVSGSGFSVGTNAATDFGPNGETGVISATVRVDASTFARPDKGETIRVAGSPAIVESVEGVAFWVIRYQKVRAVEGE